MLRFGLALAVAAVLAIPTHASAAGQGNWRSLGLYPTTGGGAVTNGAPLPMVESKIEIVVRGALVEAVVTQAFVNRSDRAIEATYIFPLPHDAAVSAMSIDAGAKTIHAAIEKRADAQRRYEAAVRAGVMAATLEQERTDVFTQTVSAIPAKGRVEITLRFDTTARFADGAWSLALPMVVAPRFVPGTASGRGTTGSGRSPDTDRAPDASRITPGASPGAGGATTVRIEFADPVKDVASPTHDVKLDAKGVASFVDKVTDHDAVVRWVAKSPAVGWIEATPDGAVAAIVVQASEAAVTRSPVRALFVIDRAATMRGDATVTAQPFVRAWFAKLRGDDRIAVLGATAIAPTTPRDALQAIEAAWRQPGTAFDLTRVLQSAKPNGAAIVLVTDGLVADDTAALAAAKKLGVPIHVVGVGAAPARGLLTRLAAQTGGTVRFVLPADDLAIAATGLAQDLATPPAPVAINWGTLAVTDVAPALLPRLGTGQAMIVVARVKRAHAAGTTANIRVRGELFAIETLPTRKPLEGAVTAAGPLARRWAKLRLDDLLVGAPNVSAITAHALTYGLVSPYTSLVAVGDRTVVDGGVKHSVAVPVSVPAGMQWDAVKQETTPVAPPEDLSSAEQPANRVSQTTKNEADKKTERYDDDEAQDSLRPKTKTKKSKPTTQTFADDEDRSEGDDEAEEEEEKEKATVDVAAAPAAEMSRSYDSVLGGAETGALYSPSATRRGVRFSVAAGGGLSIRGAQRAPAFSLGMRIDTGRGPNLLGVEGSLLGVSDDGVDAQGRLLLSFARLGFLAPFLELGLGAGVHLGAGIGPAWSISLRLHATPTLTGYLRYDGARLLRDDTARTQSTPTLGIELGF